MHLEVVERYWLIFRDVLDSHVDMTEAEAQTIALALTQADASMAIAYAIRDWAQS